MNLNDDEFQKILNEIHNNLPWKDSEYRGEQKTAIDYALTKFNNGNKFVMIQAATGNGKSLIAYQIARAFNRTLFVTPQISLQQQFIDSFESNNKKFEVQMVCAANNYQCLELPEFNCSIGICRRGNSDFKEDCPFAKAKKAALDSKIAVLNLAYLLEEINCGVPGSNKFSGDKDGKNKPDLLIIDECQNIEDAIRGFVTLEISEYFKNKFRINREIPQLDFTNHDKDMKLILSWVVGAISKLQDELKPLEKKYQNVCKKKPDQLTAQDIALIRHYGEFDGYKKRLDRFYENAVKNKDNWVYEAISDTAIQLRPIFLFNLASKYLFNVAPRVLMISATILDQQLFGNSIGIHKIEYYKMPLLFGYENHQVNYIPIGKFNYQNIKQFIPAIADTVAAIADQHPDEKGIIHLPSFYVGEGIKEHLKKNYSQVFERLVYHTSHDRNEKLQHHIDSPNSTILISPSFYEGIDMKDDLARWQIFTKIPYLNLGDKIIKIRFEKNKNWYAWMTARKMLQGMGRPVRGSDDWATTYILDENFEMFYKSNKKYFDSVGFKYKKL